MADVKFQGCWTWAFIDTESKQWRPASFQLATSDPAKAVYVLIQTNETNSPVEKYLSKVLGTVTWEVPTSWDWNMTSGVESTTTSIARRLPGNTTECTAQIRHQHSGVFVLKVTGAC